MGSTSFSSRLGGLILFLVWALSGTATDAGGIAKVLYGDKAAGAKQAIKHKPPKYFVPGMRILIEADIKEAAGLSEVRLYFKEATEIDYIYVPMESMEKYLAVLPAPLATTTSINYYISAVTAQHTEFTSATENEPHVIKSKGEVDEKSKLKEVKKIYDRLKKLGKNYDRAKALFEQDEIQVFTRGRPAITNSAKGFTKAALVQGKASTAVAGGATTGASVSTGTGVAVAAAVIVAGAGGGVAAASSGGDDGGDAGQAAVGGGDGAQQGVAQFAGTYSGTYTGNDPNTNGVFTFTADDQGNFSGNITFENQPEPIPYTGTVDENGNLTFNLPQGNDQVTGKIEGDDVFGTWNIDGHTGTWAGTLQ